MNIPGKHEEGWGELQKQFAYIETRCHSSLAATKTTVMSSPDVGAVIATVRRSQSDAAVKQVVIALYRAENAKCGRSALVQGVH